MKRRADTDNDTVTVLQSLIKTKAKTFIAFMLSCYNKKTKDPIISESES